MTGALVRCVLAVTRVTSGGHVNVQLSIMTKVGVGTSS
jgi:hypothetical protein